ISNSAPIFRLCNRGAFLVGVCSVKKPATENDSPFNIQEIRMEFINRISYSFFFVKSAVARAPRWVAVCALLAAAAGLARFNSRPVQANQGTSPHVKAVVERLKTDGDHASLAGAPLVDAAPAPYLSTIDPLLTQRRKLTALDGAASNYFGTA